MYVLGLGASVVVGAGCYRPAADPECAISCAASGLCPDGLTCGTTDGLCYAGRPCVQRPVDGAAGVDVPDGCYGLGFLGPLCPTVIGADYLVNTSLVLSTDGSSATACTERIGPAGADFCVITARHITIDGNATLRVLGTRPLVLLATEALTIRGTIDVSDGGAGADTVVCTGPGVPHVPTSATDAAGGAAGGSHFSKGGAGGAAGAFAAAAAGPTITLGSELRAGCKGGHGATNHMQVGGGLGGAGGGAIYLMAGATLEIAGKVDAHGGAGHAGAPQAEGAWGGGGGGAGGMIILDAPQVTLASAGLLLAQGGGGGAGGNLTSVGGDGAVQGAGSPATAAPGGVAGCTGCGNGGAGSTGVGAGQAGFPTSTSGSTGAGGGGGGAGYIKAYARQPSAITINGIAAPPVQ